MSLMNLQKVFASQNVVQSLGSWYFLAKIVGVTPYNRVLLPDGSYILRLSPGGLIRLGLLASWMIFVFVKNFPDLNSKKHLNQYVSVGDYTAHAMLSLTLFLSTAFFSKKSFSIVKRVSDLDKTFKSVDIRFSYENLKKRVIVRMLVGFGILTILYSCYNLFYHFLNWHFPLILSLHNFGVQFLKVLIIIKSYNNIMLLRVRFLAINRKLLSLGGPKSEIFFKEIELTKSRTHITIYKLRLIHAELCDLSGILNTTEALPIILLIGTGFVLTICNVFYWYSSWYSRAPNLLFTFFLRILIIVHYLTQGFFLLLPLTATSNEANRTGNVIHKIIRDIQDVKSKEELNVFSSQLLHRKIQFSGYGLFLMDCSLIYSVVGTITSYLVILIQFQNINLPGNANASGFDIS